MARNPKPGTRPVAGIVLVDKPAGKTSNRVLQQTKRLFQARKAGHTGTLDPPATGMLPVCLGAATRVSGLMLESSKRYRVTACFGLATDTGDATGKEIERRDGPPLERGDLEPVIARMRGEIEQVPPMYSALKHEGRRLYELARQGQEVPRQARRVRIHELELESLEWPRATFLVHCSKGTYVRSLVEDIAGELGTVAHVESLRRLSVGPFEESGMVTLEALEEAAEQGLEALDQLLLGIDAALLDRPAITVSESDCDALCHGRPVVVSSDSAAESIRIYGPASGFVGLGELAASGELKPARIFRV